MTKETQSSACPSEQLILYHYAELEEGTRRQVEHHLQQCDRCRTELSALRNVLGLVPTVRPELTAGELSNFSSRVMQKRPRPRRFGTPALGWALAATVVLLLTWNLGPQVEAPIPLPKQLTAEQEVLQQFDLLQNLDLLENLDLLQQLDRLG